MADGQGQGQAPQMESGQPQVPSETSTGQRPPEQGGGEPGHAAHWCYQCSKEVAVEPEQGGGPGSMVCTECHSGFIEALVTAQTVPDVRRAQRRRRRRGAVGAAPSPGTHGAPRQMVPISEALEHLYPQQLMQVLQMLGQANRSNSPTPGGAQSQENTAVEGNRDGGDSQTSNQEVPAAVGQGGAESPISGDGQPDSQDDRADRVESDDSRTTVPVATVEALERLAQTEEHMLFISGGTPGHDDDADDIDGVSDTETEENMRLDFGEWDSADEYGEWEEVDEDEEAAALGGDEGGVGDDNEADAQDDQSGEQSGDDRQPRAREFRIRTRNMEHNLHQYLQELLQNLVGQNVEVRVELPNGPTYVGNPGDYVDARGFEQLLQQMAENDNSRRGAPPAAKTAVDCLPSIAIEQRHHEDGSAVCAICKDVVALGEPAKQLPCFHLYHNDCILPWLGSRNSCPVCRYELPTDDPDYEEQKQSRNPTVHNTTTQSPNSGVENNNGQEINNTGGNSGHNTTGQNRDARLSNNSEQVIGASTSESSERPDDAAEGGQDRREITRECSPLQGPDTANTNRVYTSNANRDVGEGQTENDEGGRGEILRGSGRGWFFLAAAPVLSMMGLVLVLCLGNHFMGGRVQHLRRPLQRQQPHFFEESRVDQIGGASDGQSRRRWWMPFQR